MAFAFGNFYNVSGEPPGFARYRYRSDTDTRITVMAAGYFHNTTYNTNLAVNDRIDVTGTQGGYSLRVTAVSSGSVTTDVGDGDARIAAVTASTLAVTPAYDGRVTTLSRAAGIAVTLPAATGSGAKYTFVNITTVTSNNTTIKVANASDTMTGAAIVLQDGGDTMVGFETAAASSDTITWNGTTTGGINGDSAELTDIATNVWFVRVLQSGTGTEATPFSATV